MTSKTFSLPVEAASIAVMRDGGEVLLVLRGRGAALGQWAFPGGGVEAGESPKDAALRELREETGVSARLVDRLGLYAFPPTLTDPGVSLTVFRATYLSGIARAGDDARDVRWVRLDDALLLPLAEHMADALQRL